MLEQSVLKNGGQNASSGEETSDSNILQNGTVLESKYGPCILTYPVATADENTVAKARTIRTIKHFSTHKRQASKKIASSLQSPSPFQHGDDTGNEFWRERLHFQKPPPPALCCAPGAGCMRERESGRRRRNMRATTSGDDEGPERPSPPPLPCLTQTSERAKLSSSVTSPSPRYTLLASFSSLQPAKKASFPLQTSGERHVSTIDGIGEGFADLATIERSSTDRRKSLGGESASSERLTSMLRSLFLHRSCGGGGFTVCTTALLLHPASRKEAIPSFLPGSR